MPPIALSKTKLLSFLQCPKRLWLEQYSPELEDEAAFDLTAIETGRVVGAKAREVYAEDGGHLVSHDRGLRAAVAETEALLAAGGTSPIFEATFDYDGLTVQVDILDRSGSEPRIVEVKSSTAVKDHHLRDCAVQTWTLQQLGIVTGSVWLALIDPSFEYAGDGDYAGLFREVDLTPEIGGLITKVTDIVVAARETLDSLDEPEQSIGPHCQSPHACPFFEHCAPPQGDYPILGLGGRKEPLYALMQAGHRDIRDLSQEQLGNEMQQRIWRQTLSGEPFISPALKPLIDALAFPRYYLDFETIACAIPIWPETRPYQALPFQWSCHIDEGGGRVRHEEFLDSSGEPPMRQAAQSLIDKLGGDGPIIVYTSYEKRVLTELAERFPDLGVPLAALVERLVDLHPIAKAHYYHPQMHGSWSLKAILPTIGAGIDYSNLDEVRDGEAAQAAYLEAIHAGTEPERRDALRAALLAYCKLDTEAMLSLVEFFGRESQ
jgi:hypothetical protein